MMGRGGARFQLTQEGYRETMLLTILIVVLLVLLITGGIGYARR